MKECCRCGAVKPRSGFHSRRAASDGLNPACKDCICAERRERARQDPEGERAKRAAWRDKNPGYSAASSKAWRDQNPERAVENQRRWSEENAEARALSQRAWYVENREQILERMRANPNRRANEKRYREANRAAVTEAQRRRRVDKLGLKVEDVDVESLWTGICGICGEHMNRELRHPDPMSKSIDHIIPLARGGTHEKTNLQWAHLVCNLSKGARLLTELEEA